MNYGMDWLSKCNQLSPHEQVAGFLAGELFLEIKRLQLPYIIPRQAIIRPINNDKSGYNPDVIVLDQLALNKESLWAKRSTITNGDSIREKILAKRVKLEPCNRDIDRSTQRKPKRTSSYILRIA